MAIDGETVLARSAPNAVCSSGRYPLMVGAWERGGCRLSFIPCAVMSPLILLRLLIHQTPCSCPTGADSDAESGEGRTIDLRVACPSIKKPESEGELTGGIVG